MAGVRSALIVASANYTDPELRQLRAPSSDAEALAAVLSAPDIGGFDVRTLLDQPAHDIALAVEENGGPAEYVRSLRRLAERLDELGWWLGEGFDLLKVSCRPPPYRVPFCT